MGSPPEAGTRASPGPDPNRMTPSRFHVLVSVMGPSTKASAMATDDPPAISIRLSFRSAVLKRIDLLSHDQEVEVDGTAVPGSCRASSPSSGRSHKENSPVLLAAK